MKKLLLALVLALALALPVQAFDGAEATGDYYTIDLGEGNGAVVIIGDGNTIYVPPVEEAPVCTANQATATVNGDVVVVMRDTEITNLEGITTLWKKIVFVVQVDGRIKVLWAEQ